MEPDTNDIDIDLVRAMARGDRSALATLYDRYAPILLAVAARILGDRRESEDLLHDVLLETWRHADEYEASRGSVRAWLLVRLRSRALDRKKAASVARVVPLDGGHERAASFDDPSLGPDQAAVRRALAELPEEQRQVLELGYFEGLSSSEIAERIATPVGTVKSRVAAALTKLRAGLGDPSGGAR